MNRHWWAIGLVAGTVLLAGTSQAMAQALGVKGGATLATISVKTEELGGDYSRGAGVVAGAFLTFHDLSKLSWEVGGQFSMRRMSFADVIDDTVTYIEAPAVARYRVWQRSNLLVRILGGGSANFRISARESVGGDSGSVTDAYKPFEVAVVAGAQVELHNRLHVDVRYLYGVTDPFDVTVGGIRPRQNSIEILVGYRLR